MYCKQNYSLYIFHSLNINTVIIRTKSWVEADDWSEAVTFAAVVTLITVIKAQVADLESIFILLFYFEFDIQ